ncbi:NADPH-dependent FMN reductase [Aestuariibacter salexigens]|uniref:NADPH-dependent FMN reductase n=1 Tax=Aestuariibacter salexigens TaxID=226010 RepID=UPI0003F61C9B|nr:NAD(P)H-dependent oxidoreductase [Aestuariibacter salexigens]
MNNVTIVTGSHRRDSESVKIGRMIAEKLQHHDNCQSAELIDLSDFALPYWKESYSESEQAEIERVRSQLQRSDAFVFVIPEWNGMVPAAMKNLFLLYSTAEFGHKPALIASVSASIGGTYPINEMRATYKNSRICYLPEHLIYRDVGTIFNGKKNDNKDAEAYMSERTDFALNYLMLYSDALKKVRDNAPEYGDFGNGM